MQFFKSGSKYKVLNDTLIFAAAGKLYVWFYDIDK